MMYFVVAVGFTVVDPDAARLVPVHVDPVVGQIEIRVPAPLVLHAMVTEEPEVVVQYWTAPDPQSTVKAEMEGAAQALEAQSRAIRIRRQ
jgi:hypothetical protein